MLLSLPEVLLDYIHHFCTFNTLQTLQKLCKLVTIGKNRWHHVQMRVLQCHFRPRHIVFILNILDEKFDKQFIRNVCRYLPLLRSEEEQSSFFDENLMIESMQDAFNAILNDDLECLKKVIHSYPPIVSHTHHNNYTNYIYKCDDEFGIILNVERPSIDMVYRSLIHIGMNTDPVTVIDIEELLHIIYDCKLGLHWFCTEHVAMHENMHCFVHTALANALMTKLNATESLLFLPSFTIDEWRKIGVKNLKSTDYVNVGDQCCHPLNHLPWRKPERIMSVIK